MCGCNQTKVYTIVENNAQNKRRINMAVVSARKDGVTRKFGLGAWNTGTPEKEGWIRIDEMGNATGNSKVTPGDSNAKRELIIPPEAREVEKSNMQKLMDRVSTLEEKILGWEKLFNEAQEFNGKMEIVASTEPDLSRLTQLTASELIEELSENTDQEYIQAVMNAEAAKGSKARTTIIDAAEKRLEQLRKPAEEVNNTSAQ